MQSGQIFTSSPAGLVHTPAPICLQCLSLSFPCSYNKGREGEGREGEEEKAGGKEGGKGGREGEGGKGGREGGREGRE